LNFSGFRGFRKATTAKRMKIGQYCQRQCCKHVELVQFWQAFVSRGFVSNSWASLFPFEPLEKCTIFNISIQYFSRTFQDQSDFPKLSRSWNFQEKKQYFPELSRSGGNTGWNTAVRTVIPMPFSSRCLARPIAWVSGSLASFQAWNVSHDMPSCWSSHWSATKSQITPDYSNSESENTPSISHKLKLNVNTRKKCWVTD